MTPADKVVAYHALVSAGDVRQERLLIRAQMPRPATLNQFFHLPKDLVLGGQGRQLLG